MIDKLYEDIVEHQQKIAVIGLGYVGLPVAIAFAKKVKVVGFDVDQNKIDRYQEGVDMTGDIGDAIIRDCTIEFTANEQQLTDIKFFIIAVPTPIQCGNVPDLKFVQHASRIVGRKLTPGAVIVYESTVYPGVTEDICIPVLEEESGLTYGVDFKVGYSPERINPGDKVHRLENIVKVVSGNDEETLQFVAQIYELIIEAGVYRAECIKVAEAAKVIENAQRDINIAFMNELSMLFNHMKIDTKAVLKAAGTKWNFLNFTPGLVGGHCIGIDPYYLTFKAEDCGYRSKIMLAGRHINDGMGKYVAQHIIKSLVQQSHELKNARIGILGLAFKEDCPDFRNTKVIDIIQELKEYGITLIIVDPLVDVAQVYKEHGIELSPLSALNNMNAIAVAVPHKQFVEMDVTDFANMYCSNEKKVLFDIKGIYERREFEERDFYYWSL
ncbi:nucleotide sugar dehydrogenase [Sporosarcina sp. FSL K6-1508]|uniref:nucleotide sugar dehydrogenase n=1 Tax=Sporosarcina sp. FSL K6-1508 TaxID=2921553 RepID=UPI0030F9161E